MKKILLILSSFLGFCLFSNGQTAPTPTWVKMYTGPDSLYNFPTAVDGNGNVVVAGTAYFRATGYDYVVIKYDKNGNQLWTRTYDDPNMHSILNVTCNCV